MPTNLCSCCIPFHLCSSSDEDGHDPDDINAEGDGEHVPVDLDELMEYIARLLELIEKRKPTGSKRTWPGGSDLKKLNEILSSGKDFASDLKDYVSGPVKEILKGIGYASVATAGLLVVAYSLERFDDVSSNKEDCLQLLKEMSYVASLIKQFKESRKGMQNVIEEATTLIVEGAIMCAAQIDSSPWKSFLLASTQKKDLEGTKEKLVSMHSKINDQIGLRVYTAFEKSPLSRLYPKNAVGLVEPIKEVLGLLACESEEKVVTVILHGFGGTGKTTLADAVFSKVGGCKYSKVRLFKNIDSSPDILSLQNLILKDLMGPEDTITDIRTEEDGQRQLGVMLEKVEAFIYIDNVLEGNALKMLLPLDMGTAKKLRLLLTAREENVKNSLPRPFTNPKIYLMKGIPAPEAMLILKEEIKEGIDESQFNGIIETCCGLPLMLTLAAPFIGRAENKTEAYSTLMLERGKWEIEGFNPMRYAFAYDALSPEWRDPLLDICSYFKSWKWDIVEDIVGKKILETFKNRALVSKDANGFASVHDVILTLAFQKSEESEGKNVRRTFTTAKELEQFFQKKDTEGIKGIWFSGTTDVPFHITDVSTLDSMSKSVRVVHLGNLTTTVEDNSSRIFAELVYFKAENTHLPFDVSKSKQLRYLAYKPGDDLRLSEMPSSLTHMEFDGRSQSRSFQISSTDLQQLRNLRILRLKNFKTLKNLPEGLGDHLVNGLQELSLSRCESLWKLPRSISKFRFLRILKLNFCPWLTELPENLGLLNSLQELDLSHCGTLLNLPPDLGNLTRLVNLNLGYCCELENIPESISKLKLMGALEMSYCCALKELPCGFCNLSSITSLSLVGCQMLAKLPDQFGQLRSLTVLDLSDCYELEKLPQGFGQLQCLEGLVLSSCSNLRELCNDFHCLSSLQNLDLSFCMSLDNIPEDFHRLPSLQRLKLLFCHNLEGKCMDNLVNMNTLQFLYIEGSEQLVKRWTEIQREGGHQSNSITVISEQDHLSMSDGQREDIEDKVLSEFDSLLKNGKGEPFRISDLPLNTGILVVYDLDPENVDFPWSLIEETIDDLQINFKIIHIGAGFDKLPSKVKDGILVVHLPKDRASKMLETVVLTLDAGTRDAGQLAVESDRCYLLMLTKMDAGDGKSDKYRASWRFLTESELEEYVVGNCRRYLRLKQRAETSGESNIDLLTELFGPAEKTTHIFQKNSPSQQAPSTCGVDKLEGKAILLEMRPLDLCYDIRRQSLKEMYDVVKKGKFDIEIISIPIMVPKQHQQYSVVMDIYNQFAREVPWLVLQNPWTVMTRVVKFFLAKQAGGERVAKQVGWGPCDGNEVSCEGWYPSINLIIDPNGRITAYQSCILSMLDRCEEVKIIYKHLESVSYQVRWGAKAWPFNHERIEELRKEEWKQAKSMSPLHFHFNHLESVSDQVKKLMFQGNLICFLTGNHETRTCSIVKDLRDVIPIIHIDNKCERFWLTDTIYKKYFCLLEKTTEMEGATLSLSADESMRFWIRNLHLKEEINGMEESDEQLCDLKSLLHSFQPGVCRWVKFDSTWSKFEFWEKITSMIFLEENGKKIVATTSEETMNKLFEPHRTERAKRWIKIMVKHYKKEGNQTHNEDSNNSDSLAKNMRTVATAVEQENVDLDSLSEYISDLLEVQHLYLFFKFNKDRKFNCSRPKAATWPTSKGFSMLKNFLSEGTEANWVKDVISSHPEQDKWKIVTRSILKGIGEAHWAAAGLLMVAEVSENVSAHPTENGSAYRTEYMFDVLEETLRLAQYIKQFNEKPGVWTQMKRAATAWIVTVSIRCCSDIDPRFTTLTYGGFPYPDIQTNLRRMLDALANAIAECLPNEGGSHLEELYEGLDFLLESESESESESEGGPSSAQDQAKIT